MVFNVENHQGSQFNESNNFFEKFVYIFNKKKIKNIIKFFIFIIFDFLAKNKPKNPFASLNWDP